MGSDTLKGKKEQGAVLGQGMDTNKVRVTGDTGKRPGTRKVTILNKQHPLNHCKDEAPPDWAGAPVLHRHMAQSSLDTQDVRGHGGQAWQDQPAGLQAAARRDRK